MSCSLCVVTCRKRILALYPDLLFEMLQAGGSWTAAVKENKNSMSPEVMVLFHALLF